MDNQIEENHQAALRIQEDQRKTAYEYHKQNSRENALDHAFKQIGSNSLEQTLKDAEIIYQWLITIK